MSNQDWPTTPPLEFVCSPLILFHLCCSLFRTNTDRNFYRKHIHFSAYHASFLLKMKSFKLHPFFNHNLETSFVFLESIQIRPFLYDRVKNFPPDKGGSPEPSPSLELLAVERIARRASTLGQIPRRITGHVGPGPLITPANSANWSLRISWFRT